MKKDTTDTYIPAFFADRNIFITGGTGFLGKALIEKLLRSCPDIAKIYLLIRPKKGLDINERLKKMLENKIFDKLRHERPSNFDKLVPIAGDVNIENLGLRSVDRQILIENISIVFHAAANVRFDDDLKTAILSNTRSTRDICILAQSMTKLAALVHVSSAFTQSDKPVVEEIIYPFDVDWKKMIKIAENIDDDYLKTFTAKCLGSIPNTYIFSKKLAEQVINDYSESLPCTIIRPSIVVSAMEEPTEGWIDNFNGPIGTYIGGGKGILRVVYLDPLTKNDYLPVDAFIKSLIIVSWIRGIKSIAEDNTVHVYNSTSYGVMDDTTGHQVQTSFELTKNIPLERIIWSPFTSLTKNYLKYYILVLLLHVLPALFIDGILKLLHLPPILLKLQRRIFLTNIALSYFLLNTWQFHNEKVRSIFDNISADNKKDFGFDYVSFDLQTFIKKALIGAKIYLLHEDMNNLEVAKLHRRRMDWLHNTVKTLFILFMLWIFYCKNTLSYIVGIFMLFLYIY